MCSAAPCPGTPPTPRPKLKAILLWCARHLNPCGEFYAGPVEVRVSFKGQADSAIVEPTVDVDGLTAPSGVSVGPKSDALPPASELARTFLGDDDRAILRALAERQPCQASEVQQAVAAAGVSRSNFWPAWKQLQVRLLVAEGPGGFRLGPPWLAALVTTLALALVRGQGGGLVSYYLGWAA